MASIFLYKKYDPDFFHGIIDYIYCVLLIAASLLFHFNTIRVQTYVVDTVAASVLTYSMFTKYQFKFFREYSHENSFVIGCNIQCFSYCFTMVISFCRQSVFATCAFGVAGLVVVLLSSPKEPENIIAKTT